MGSCAQLASCYAYHRKRGPSSPDRLVDVSLTQCRSSLDRGGGSRRTTHEALHEALLAVVACAPRHASLIHVMWLCPRNSPDLLTQRRPGGIPLATGAIGAAVFLFQLLPALREALHQLIFMAQRLFHYHWTSFRRLAVFLDMSLLPITFERMWATRECDIGCRWAHSTWSLKSHKNSGCYVGCYFGGTPLEICASISRPAQV